MVKTRMMKTTYVREGYAFECIDSNFFALVLKTVANAPDIQSALKSAQELKANNHSLCNIFRIEPIL